MSAAAETAIKSAEIVRDAGGEIVGRSRLQKSAYLLELAGLGSGFQFEYGEAGPYSSQIAKGIKLARAMDFIKEEELRTDWGGFYSIYRYDPHKLGQIANERAEFLSAVTRVSAVALELLATAVFISAEEHVADNPWEETRRRKPTKAAEGRLELAIEAYRDLVRLKTPKPLPKLPTEAPPAEAPA